MASDRLVRYIITADSSGALRGFKDVGRASEETASKLEKSGSRMKSAGASMVSTGRSLTAATLPIALLGGYAVKSAMDFQTSMTRVQTQAGASAKEIKVLGSAILGLSGKVAQSPEELAKGLFYIESAGYKAGAAYKFLEVAAKGATISGASVTEQANVLSGVMKNNFKDIHNAGEAMGSMISIVGKGKMTLSDLNEAMGTGILQAASTAGLSFRQLGAAVDVMTRHQVPAQIAMTRLRLNLQQAMDPKGVAVKALSRIGIGANRLAEDMKKPGGLITMLEDLKHHLGGVSEIQANKIVGESFGGAKGAANMYALLKDLPELKQLYAEQTGTGAKQLNQAFGVTAETTAVKMAKAIDSMKASLIRLGEILIPTVVPVFLKLVKLLESASEWFKKLPKPIQEIGIYLGMVGVASGPVLIFFGNLTKAGGGLLKVIDKLTSILPGFGAAAGTAGEEASAGIAGLLPEIAALSLAAAGLLASYEAIKAIKNYLSGSTGAAKTPGARALKKLHQPSEFSANTTGALHMLGGATGNPLGIAPGSYGEAQWLKEHAGGLRGAELGGHAAAETAAGKAFRERIKERNEKIELHAHLYIGDRQISETVATYIRNHPQSEAARKLTEGVTQNAKIRNRGQ